MSDVILTLTESLDAYTDLVRGLDADNENGRIMARRGLFATLKTQGVTNNVFDAIALEVERINFLHSEGLGVATYNYAAWKWVMR